MTVRDDIENAPEEVQVVHAAMMENARQRWSEEDMKILRPVYTHRGDSGYAGGYELDGSWIVGPNYEGMGPWMMWKDGVWSYRGGRADKTMPGGFSEALANAKIFFTG